MKESLFKAIWLDWRKPKLRIKLSDHPHEWYGTVFQINLKKSTPAVANMDAWTHEDWQVLQTYRLGSTSYMEAINRGLTIEVVSCKIDEIEIIGFNTWEKPKKTKTFHKTRFLHDEWVYGPHYDIEALKDWESQLESWNLIRNPDLLPLE